MNFCRRGCSNSGAGSGMRPAATLRAHLLEGLAAPAAAGGHRPRSAAIAAGGRGHAARAAQQGLRPRDRPAGSSSARRQLGVAGCCDPRHTSASGGRTCRCRAPGSIGKSPSARRSPGLQRAGAQADHRVPGVVAGPAAGDPVGLLLGGLLGAAQAGAQRQRACRHARSPGGGRSAPSPARRPGSSPRAALSGSTKACRAAAAPRPATAGSCRRARRRAGRRRRRGWRGRPGRRRTVRPSCLGSARPARPKAAAFHSSTRAV
jgi:hypothetical protein